MNPKDQIKAALSIFDVVSMYLRLDKAGSQYRARCPFHNERTPSFYVSPDRGTFHCFGCGAHGDIFSFVERIETIPFVEALRLLADKAGITVTHYEKNESDSKVIALLKEATSFFEVSLKENLEAQTYLKERGLENETITRFQIGYAPNEWRTLFIHLAHKGYSPEDMVQAGVMIEAEKDGKKIWYDRFRGRVMFPIRNISGVVVGYSGRILPSFATDTQGKYVNTPETEVYHKSKILFGYDTAKKMMQEKKEVVLVEGQMDLCMSYQAGVHNTVAVSGTALTDYHVALIKRLADRVVLSFDSDQAGRAASKKSALMALYGGLDVYVLSLAHKDPAEMIRENTESWTKLISTKVHIIDYTVREVLSSLSDPREQRRSIVREVFPFIYALSSPVDRDYFIDTVSQHSKIPKEILIAELQKGTPIETEKTESGGGEPQKISLVEKRKKELLAFAQWKQLLAHPRIKEHVHFISDFPEEIIEEEILRVERMGVVGDVEAHLSELAKSLEKELVKVEEVSLQARLDAGEDGEELLKERERLAAVRKSLYK